MERRNLSCLIIVCILCFVLVVNMLSCSKVPPPTLEVDGDVNTSATLWMNPLAIAVPGDNPLWFELKDEVPSAIVSPTEASLKSFLPWPHSTHITSMLMQDNRLVMAVNRLGFLAVIPWDDSRLGLYSVFDRLYWNRYSAASLFTFHQTPSVLLYRDDFFLREETFPLPETQVVTLVKGSRQPIKGDIPAFRDFPSSKGWDIEALNCGRNGAWYFIATQKSSDIHEKLYYQTESLDAAPSSISMGEYWLALEPESIRNTPILLQHTVESAAKSRGSNHSYLIEVIVPNTELKQRYSYHSGESKSDMLSLLVYADDEKALAVFPDGSGTVGIKNADASIATSAFNLPELPQDFVYTGIAVLNNTVIASWEEQQFYSVGAAGFVMVQAQW